MFFDGMVVASDGSIYFGETIQKGDVIGVRNIMNVYETEQQSYHHLILYKNGEKFGHPIILEGNNQISAVFVHDNKDKKIQIEDLIEQNLRRWTVNIL